MCWPLLRTGMQIWGGLKSPKPADKGQNCVSNIFKQKLNFLNFKGSLWLTLLTFTGDRQENMRWWWRQSERSYFTSIASRWRHFQVLVLETFPSFGAREISKFLKPGMGPLLLLSVTLHCFCQTAASQQQEQLDQQGQKQGEQEQADQGQEAVRGSGYYLASVNRSEKSEDSGRHGKSKNLKDRSICTGPQLLLNLELCAFST